MARFIDAEEITRRILYFYHHTKGDSGEHYAYAKALSQIDHTPTADVVEVKHGEWHLLDDCANEGVYCSVCHKKVYRKDYANQKLKSKYCPNCGAKMEVTEC